MAEYLPSRGDVVWLDFDPQAGREQAGRRPALVVSPLAYNQITGLMLVCPITSHVKGFRFEVPVPPELPIRGVILADHLKSADWRARRAEHICHLPGNCVLEVIARIQPLIT